MDLRNYKDSFIFQKNNLPISDNLGNGFIDHLKIRLCDYTKKQNNLLRLFNTKF